MQALSINPISLIQAQVDTEDLKLALRRKEVHLDTKAHEVDLMHLWIKNIQPESPWNKLSLLLQYASFHCFF